MVDLCVVSYNTWSLLDRQITTLLSDAPSQDRSWTYYVADNGSTDGSDKYLRDSTTPRNVFYNENIGYAAACNQMAAKGEGDIIGLLNADTWFTTADVLGIQRAFDEDPDVAILGPKQRDERGFIVHAGIEGTNEAPKHRGWKQPDPEDKLYRDKKEVVTVSGSAYFVRRSVWEELYACPIDREIFPTATGCFGSYGHYYEETWCSYHARAHGFKVWYDGRISIGHSWHASHPVGSPQDRMFQASQATFRSACDRHNIAHD